MSSVRNPRTRREVLRAGALAALALPIGLGAAACGKGYADGPDPLVPLAEQAKADAAAADEAAKAAPEQAALAQQVAAARRAHATALQSEIDRQNQPKGGPGAIGQNGKGLAGLKQRLAVSRRQAADLVPGLPAYRAGLVASVAAGCAALQRTSDQLGPGEDATVDPAAAPQPPAEAGDAVQEALAAEHAAIWVYGLVTAFLPDGYQASATDSAAEHRARRDACERMLASAGVTAKPAQPAYVTPKPVTDGKSAMAVVAIAETDVATAWRGVIERTDDRGLRGFAVLALTGAARRCTRWRVAAGEHPSAPALPGTPQS
ncbi:ferritin-like domain-containing protein [Amycolatopsis sp. CA-230715]|uniref:ferritin-like domain-containing protein n=1 Tax=Amycolatopsis sp. CA-230715 TaxID=2745196 RepID=UPI0020B2603F|nr:ferritin-like domain-containing protein [Amycolatopsis sp. CA-230715]